LIQLLCFLSPDLIHVKMLKAGAKGVTGDLKSILSTEYNFQQSLDGLRTFSLIREWDSGRKISIHRLVQRVVKDAMPGKQLEEMAGEALGLTVVASLGNPVERNTVDELVPATSRNKIRWPWRQRSRDSDHSGASSNLVITNPTHFSHRVHVRTRDRFGDLSVDCYGMDEEDEGVYLHRGQVE
jgi:hypothetical protein